MESQKQQQMQMCSGQCAMCQFQQRVYCAAYLARNNYAMMGAMLEKLDSMQNEMADMKTRINAIQSSESELIKPFDTEADGSFETKHTKEQAV